ncbi:MAG: Flp family type IVb pilin [Acidimicrobiia bacterium]|nr:Flp family type IVb pilin [Acidimicrobiia bacterium]MBJ7382263.1 Flp family type IVb pilin [Acidimicrobiia bacterium]
METLTRLYISLTNLSVRSKDETGATAVEYALLVALIAAVITVAVVALQGRITDALDSVEIP